MLLFETKGIDFAYENYLDAPILHEEDGCGRCHAIHQEEGEFQAGCNYCDIEKCINCNGEGYIQEKGEEFPCKGCNSLGRITRFY